MSRRRTAARDRATTLPGSRVVAPVVALSVALVLALAACGGDDEPAAGESPSSTSSDSGGDSGGDSGDPATEPSPYLPVQEGVELTAQGSELELGDTASVAWRPRTTTLGVLEVTVRAVQRAPLSVFSGFRLDKETRASAAYFVRVRIENTGESNLSGAAIPLYLVDETNTLIQASTFASRFQPCPSMTFPRGFTPGEKISTCLVFLAPDKGAAEAVSFRPAQSFNPIIWTGDQTRYRPGAAKKKPQQKQDQ